MNWISVKDRLPESALGNYIACLENEAVMELAFSDINERWWSLSAGDVPEENKVTHWMPLPEPPKEGKV